MATKLEREWFEKYAKGSIFLEIGTGEGDTIDFIVREFSDKFVNIHGCDLVEMRALSAAQRFSQIEFGKVQIWQTEGVECIKLISGIYGMPITFWLDSHTQYLNNLIIRKPLISELKEIKKLSNNENTIFINDMNELGKENLLEITKEEVIEQLKEINSNYKLIYLGDDNNILCATVRTDEKEIVDISSTSKFFKDNGW